MPSDGSVLSSHRNQHGGRRPGSGRKPTWPSGAAMKSMRLPAVLEEELRRYARQRLAEIKRDQAGTRLRLSFYPRRRVAIGVCRRG